MAAAAHGLPGPHRISILAQGETLGNFRHGKGTHTCANGDCYEGNWKYDKRDGKGKMTFKDGLMYEGDWKEDQADGCVCMAGISCRHQLQASAAWLACTAALRPCSLAL